MSSLGYPCLSFAFATAAVPVNLTAIPGLLMLSLLSSSYPSQSQQCKFPYTLSLPFFYCLLFLDILCFDISSVGCVFLYTGQEKFHASTTDTLDYVVRQANFTAENLRNVSDYLNAAKKVDVQSIVLPGDVLSSIDNIQGKINSSATTLSVQTMENQDRIQDVLDNM